MNKIIKKYILFSYKQLKIHSLLLLLKTGNCPEGFSRKKYQDGSNAIDFFYLGGGRKTYFFSGGCCQISI